MPAAPRPVVLALGQFDGIHLGHQAVLRAALDLASDLGASARCLTFEPHVMRILDPARAPLELATPGQNNAHILDCGLDGAAVFPFDREWATRSALDFLRALPDVVRAPVLGVTAGADFAFGRNREATSADLPALAAAAGIPHAVIVPPVLWNGAPVSSSRIRAAVAEGDMDSAAAMLGRPFALEGDVVHGRAVGRRHGLPTANVRPILPIRPKPGVYAARLGPHPAAAFVPDLADPAQSSKFGDIVEVHVLDATGDWYGRRVEVQFLHRIRPYIPFPDQTVASAQIRLDIEAMKPWLDKETKGTKQETNPQG
jgi:riboflavin kinase/FMN adenylyltransferase